MPRIETYEDQAGGFRCRLVADNGEIVAPIEGHTRPEDAERAFLTAHRLTSQVLYERALATGAPFTRVPRPKAEGGGFGAGEKPRGK